MLLDRLNHWLAGIFAGEALTPPPPGFFDRWQTLIAGSFAILATLITVFFTLRTERRKADRELDALRKSLAVELRQQIPNALGVCNRLRERATSKSGLPITARIVESLSRTPSPILYSANAGKIGLLGGDAMNVVIIYTQLEFARDAINRLTTTYRPPDNISPVVVWGAGDAFLEPCKYARGILPKLRTGDPSHDATDEDLIQKINDAAAILKPSFENPLPPWPGSPSA